MEYLDEEVVPWVHFQSFCITNLPKMAVMVLSELNYWEYCHEDWNNSSNFRSEYSRLKLSDKDNHSVCNITSKYTFKR